MADYLLVHGAGHGAWCWRDILPLLADAGHRARAIDLPGSGDDPTPHDLVTLATCRDAILGAIDTPVILVGHSMAGYAISAAAMAAPDKIAGLVYVCAYLPEGEKTMAERRFETPHQPLSNVIQKSSDGLSYSFDPSRTVELFYSDCPPETVEFAMKNLTPQAISPSQTPVPHAAELARLPRHYVRCMNDRVIPPQFQITMTRDWPDHDITEMRCGHSPFFAQPDRLAEILLKTGEA